MADTQETIANIIAEMETERPGLMNAPMNTNNLYYARRLKAAHKREREAITPKSNPDWKDICAKCKDGDIEPNYCEYYEEPNGCNSPIYGEHPTAKKSLVVGDCAKMREALSAALDMIFDLQVCNRSPIANSVYAVRRKIKAALAAPARNCDSYDSADEMIKEYADDAFLEEWKEWRETGKCNPLMTDALLCINWLFLTNEKGETNGSK